MHPTILGFTLKYHKKTRDKLKLTVRHHSTSQTSKIRKRVPVIPTTIEKPTPRKVLCTNATFASVHNKCQSTRQEFLLQTAIVKNKCCRSKYLWVHWPRTLLLLSTYYNYDDVMCQISTK